MHYAYNTDTTDDVPDGVLTGVTLFDTNRVLYRYDYLQRQSRRIIKEKPGQNESVEDKRTILEETYAYSTNSAAGTTTNRVSTKRVFWNGTEIHQFQHGYDALGNITSIYDAKTLQRVNYTYDDQGQLKKAVHKENGTTTREESYTYDNVGNITHFDNGSVSHNYTYGNSNWKDLLTSVDGNSINYDLSGNPTRYYNGYTMTWAEGRRLESVTVGGQTYTYQYNADGQRIKKTNPDGSYVEYHVVNGVTVGESHYGADKKKTHNIRYTLDENNSVIGFTTGGVNYYFAKNLQGDVLEVYNASTNEVVAQYTYDSWGNILTATGSMKDTNPFRYRGYYYDGETGFYYLQSRYYDAGIGRFINADVFTSTGQGILGNNMFSYCLNNPSNFNDPAGKRSGPASHRVKMEVNSTSNSELGFFEWFLPHMARPREDGNTFSVGFTGGYSGGGVSRGKSYVLSADTSYNYALQESTSDGFSTGVGSSAGLVMTYTNATNVQDLSGVSYSSGITLVALGGISVDYITFTPESNPQSTCWGLNVVVAFGAESDIHSTVNYSTSTQSWNPFLELYELFYGS